MSTISDSPGRTGPRAELVHERPLRAGARDRRLALAPVRAQVLRSPRPAPARPSAPRPRTRGRRPSGDDEPRISTTRAIAASVARCAARIPASARSSLTRRRSWNCSRSGRTATPFPRRKSAATTGNDGGTTTSFRPSSPTTRPSTSIWASSHLHPPGDQLARAELGAQQDVGGTSSCGGRHRPRSRSSRSGADRSSRRR